MPWLRSIRLGQRSFELIFSSIVPSFTLYRDSPSPRLLLEAPCLQTFTSWCKGLKKNVDAVQACHG